MAITFTRLKNISFALNTICKQFGTINLNKNQLSTCITQMHKSGVISTFSNIKTIHTCTKRCDLMEFFDDEKNWGEQEVKCGRSWNLDELRIKSNQDLHKLWYVLLKERNMLLTMEQVCNEEMKLFPSPERIDKVKDSMKNLETVVRERNKAYHMLETGQTGERPVQLVQNELGYHFRYRQTEHLIPKELNTAWRKTHKFNPRGHAVKKFILHMMEKKFIEKKRKLNRDHNHVMGLMKRFPNMDIEAVKEQYPGVDIEKCRNNKKARGHFIPNN